MMSLLTGTMRHITVTCWDDEWLAATLLIVEAFGRATLPSWPCAAPCRTTQRFGKRL